MQVNILLSDKFVEFSSKIASLHEKKKQESAVFKKAFEDHRAFCSKLDADVVEAQNEFTAWQTEQEAAMKAEAAVKTEQQEVKKQKQQ